MAPFREDEEAAVTRSDDWACHREQLAGGVPAQDFRVIDAAFERIFTLQKARELKRPYAEYRLHAEGHAWLHGARSDDDEDAAHRGEPVEATAEPAAIPLLVTGAERITPPVLPVDVPSAQPGNAQVSGTFRKVLYGLPAFEISLV